MTGYTVHTGSNKKFTAGWDRIFKKAASGKKTATSRKTAGSKRKK
jgi:hypothetical protein